VRHESALRKPLSGAILFGDLAQRKIIFVRSGLPATIGSDQVMHQPVVIGPTANPIEPGLEQFEFAVRRSQRRVSPTERRRQLFFKNRAGKKADRPQPTRKLESAFFPHLSPESEWARGASLRYTSRADWISSLKNHCTLRRHARRSAIFSKHGGSGAATSAAELFRLATERLDCRTLGHLLRILLSWNFGNSEKPVIHPEQHGRSRCPQPSPSTRLALAGG